MKEKAKLQKLAESILSSKSYEVGFYAGVINNCQNTERLLKEIIDDYNKRIA